MTEKKKDPQRHPPAPKRARKGSQGVVTVTAAKGAIEVTVKERADGRGSRYYAEYRHPTQGRKRPSLQTDDLEVAKYRAKEIADELALETNQGTVEDLARTSQYSVTLEDLFAAYRAVKLPMFVGNNGKPNGHWVNLDRTMRVTLAILGPNQPVCEVGEADLDLFKRTRKAGEFEIVGSVLPDQYDKLLFPPDPVVMGACGPSTVRGELALLSVIFNWGWRHKVPGGRGRTLLASNPIKGISLRCGVEEPKRPVMTDARHQMLLKYAPTAEKVTRDRFPGMPAGFLHTLLMLGRGTARRIQAILGVRIRDVLLSRDQVRAKLLELSWPEEWAEEWPYGAMFWDPEFDKEGYSRVIPISKRLHDTLAHYLGTRGTMHPDAWLIPSPVFPDRQPTKAGAWVWLQRIVKCAQEAGEDFLPMPNGAWHPYRREWRAERAGFFDQKLVALVGGWRRFPGSEEAMNQGYLTYHPRALYLTAEFDLVRDDPNDGTIPGVNIVVHAPDVPPNGVLKVVNGRTA